MKAYQAYASGKSSAVAATARQAAKDFFAKNPRARKCNVTQGEDDGRFFTVIYGRASEGKWPANWKDVTPKTIDQLPDEVTE